MPTVTFPKYQIFTPDKYHIKANMCIALNKRMFPNIKMNGGGDLCQPTLNNLLLKPSDFPLIKIPIWNYDSVFKTKNIISKDRARFFLQEPGIRNLGNGVTEVGEQRN